RLLYTSCDTALKNAIDVGILAAHEARSVFRHKLLQDQLTTIQRNLEFLTSQEKLDIQKIHRFEQEYRDQIKIRHGYITPPFVDATRKIPIDEIYVSSDLIYRSTKEENDTLSFNRKEFLS